MAFEEIDKFIKTGGNKLTLENGKVYKVQLKGAEIVAGRFGKQVCLRLMDMADMETKKLYTASKKLLKKIFQENKIKEGQFFAIRKAGDRYETEYEIRKIEGKKEAELKETAKAVKEENEIDIDNIDM